MFLYLHAPRRIDANPPNPRTPRPRPATSSSYPDYEQSFVFEDNQVPEDNHVITIDI